MYRQRPRPDGVGAGRPCRRSMGRRRRAPQRARGRTTRWCCGLGVGAEHVHHRKLRKLCGGRRALPPSAPPAAGGALARSRCASARILAGASVRPVSCNRSSVTVLRRSNSTRQMISCTLPVVRKERRLRFTQSSRPIASEKSAGST